MKTVGLVVDVAALLHAAPAVAQLAVLDVGTAKPATLARGTADGWTSVRWTGDGSALIAVAIEPKGLAIRRYPAGGGRARLVRRLPQSAEGDELYEAGLQLAWSRDGARVAYGALSVGARR